MFLQTNTKYSEKEIKKTSPFTMVSQIIKIIKNKPIQRDEDLQCEIYKNNRRN